MAGLLAWPVNASTLIVNLVVQGSYLRGGRTSSGGSAVFCGYPPWVDQQVPCSAVKPPYAVPLARLHTFAAREREFGMIRPACSCIAAGRRIATSRSAVTRSRSPDPRTGIPFDDKRHQIRRLRPPHHPDQLS